ncbi:hypothetical protein SESBI_24058 [Sesbania bispinosa]|nr:hypothetical protein SESBI_24058 [Sesbania bispinosa]
MAEKYLRCHVWCTCEIGEKCHVTMGPTPNAFLRGGADGGCDNSAPWTEAALAAATLRDERPRATTEVVLCSPVRIEARRRWLERALVAAAPERWLLWLDSSC